MPINLEFGDPYCELMDSFCEPEEPLRMIENLSFVGIRNGTVWGQSQDNRQSFDIAVMSWCDINDSVKFTTTDGKEWAQMKITTL